MKDFNKILYDILLKINSGNDNKFILNSNLVFKYFEDLKNKKIKILMISVIISPNFLTFALKFL